MGDYNDGMDIIKENTMRDLGLYIHIPFCVKKCDYCDFLSAPATEEIKSEYFDAIITEIESYQGKMEGYIVPTIFFGGGTPSCVEAVYISRIMESISKVFCIDRERLEASIEVNPGTITRDKLIAYKEAGINRLSFGLQSANDIELLLLGRIHSYKQFEDNYHLAREVGFQNINIDLMSALPGQTVESWEHTLNTVIDLKPEHISAYSLIIEEGTKFYDRYHNTSSDAKELPDEETDRLIYHRTKEFLELKGYHRYEISNYAKEGYECRHNSSYWIGTDYLGIGLGASSLLNDARFLNLQDIKQYIQACEEYKTSNNQKKYEEINILTDSSIWDDPIGLRRDFEQLTQSQKMEEFMFLGLRMCDGISKRAFYQRFKVKIETIYGAVLQQLKENNLLIITDDKIVLTEYGIDVSNSVLSVFLLN
jgi:oxygen-independent coproporphyrinogen-3 oxidase